MGNLRLLGNTVFHSIGYTGKKAIRIVEDNTCFCTRREVGATFSMATFIGHRVPHLSGIKYQLVRHGTASPGPSPFLSLSHSRCSRNNNTVMEGFIVAKWPADRISIHRGLSIEIGQGFRVNN